MKIFLRWMSLLLGCLTSWVILSCGTADPGLPSVTTELATGKGKFMMDMGQAPTVSPLNDLVAVPGICGAVGLFDLADPTRLRPARLKVGPKCSACVSMAFSNDGDLLLVGFNDSSLMLLDTLSGEPRHHSLKLAGEAPKIRKILSLPKAHAFIVSTDMGFKKIVIDKGKGLVDSWETPLANSPDLLGISQSGKIIALVGDSPGNITLIDASDGSRMAIVKLGADFEVTSATFSYDDETLFAGTASGHLIATNISGRETNSALYLEETIHEAIAAPWNDLVVVVFARSVALLDVSSARIIAKRKISRGAVGTAISFTEGGRELVFSRPGSGKLFRWGGLPEFWLQHLRKTGDKELDALAQEKKTKVLEFMEPRGEFETPAKYQLRVDRRAGELKELESTYSDKKRRLEKTVNHRMNSFVFNTRRKHNITFEIGRYDAVRQEFPVVLGHRSLKRMLKIGIDVAPGFKDVALDGQVQARALLQLKRDGSWEMLDVEFHDTVNGGRYYLGNKPWVSQSTLGQ